MIYVRVQCTNNIRVLLVCFIFFPAAFFHPRVTGACSVTTDLIMRVKCENSNVMSRICEEQIAILLALPS